jgi:hypothetical protein
VGRVRLTPCKTGRTAVHCGMSIAALDFTSPHLCHPSVSVTPCAAFRYLPVGSSQGALANPAHSTLRGGSARCTKKKRTWSRGVSHEDELSAAARQALQPTARALATQKDVRARATLFPRRGRRVICADERWPRHYARRFTRCSKEKAAGAAMQGLQGRRPCGTVVRASTYPRFTFSSLARVCTSRRSYAILSRSAVVSASDGRRGVEVSAHQPRRLSAAPDRLRLHDDSRFDPGESQGIRLELLRETLADSVATSPSRGIAAHVEATPGARWRQFGDT